MKRRRLRESDHRVPLSVVRGGGIPRLFRPAGLHFRSYEEGTSTLCLTLLDVHDGMNLLSRVLLC